MAGNLPQSFAYLKGKKGKFSVGGTEYGNVISVSTRFEADDEIEIKTRENGGTSAVEYGSVKIVVELKIAVKKRGDALYALFLDHVGKRLDAVKELSDDGMFGFDSAMAVSNVGDERDMEKFIEVSVSMRSTIGSGGEKPKYISNGAEKTLDVEEDETP